MQSILKIILLPLFAAVLAGCMGANADIADAETGIERIKKASHWDVLAFVSHCTRSRGPFVHVHYIVSSEEAESIRLELDKFAADEVVRRGLLTHEKLAWLRTKKCKSIRVGMSEEEVFYLFGYASSVNKSGGAYGSRTQKVYESHTSKNRIYVYFEGTKVVSWQY